MSLKLSPISISVLEAKLVTVTVNFVEPVPVSVMVTVNADVALIQLARDWENDHCMHISPHLSSGVNTVTKS